MRSHSLGFFPSGLCRVNGVCVADLHFSTSAVAAKGTTVILWCLGIFIFVFISSLLIFFWVGQIQRLFTGIPGKVAEIPRSKEMSLQVKIMKHLRDITNKKERSKLNYHTHWSRITKTDWQTFKISKINIQQDKEKYQNADIKEITLKNPVKRLDMTNVLLKWTS